jgi:hypothetical protein
MVGCAMLPRRTLLSSLAMAGCASPIPSAVPGGSPTQARALLGASAEAHGQTAFAGITDISVSYAGTWRPLVNRLQPALVDAGYRGGSEERMLPGLGLVAQAHAGPAGHKQVLRRWGRRGEGGAQVWLDGREATDADRLHAAALVADAYALFLLGPLLLAGPWAADRTAGLELAAPERIAQDGTLHPCDVVRVGLTPGLGLSAADQLVLYLDADTRLMRRIRFTLDGLEGTRGAVADVDTLDHQPLAGVRWPTRFHEQLQRPVPLPVHDWRLTGLDVNRGMTVEDVSGPGFRARAERPAQALGA